LKVSYKAVSYQKGKITGSEWSILDSLYFIIISLTTIGFGDFIPRNDPPVSQATHQRNETACLFELINPVPSKNVNNETGISHTCNPVLFTQCYQKIKKGIIQNIWPSKVQAYYSLYRMSVFFWILIGLTWLGGVISMLTENFNASIKDVTSVRLNPYLPTKVKRSKGFN